MIRAMLDDLTAHAEDMAGFLMEIVAMDSPSRDKELVDLLGRKLADDLRDRGANVEVLSEETLGDHLRATWGDGSDRPVLVLAHMDTVWPADETTRRPPRREGGVLYGPGAFDMKAGITQALFAIDALQRSGASVPPIELMITSDEEIGSPSSRTHIEEAAGRARAALIVEPASETGVLKTARKGIGMYTLTIDGVAAHAGLEPEKGASALLELAHQTLDLHGLTDLSQGITVNVGVVQGGSARNVVAARAIAEIDLRVTTAAQADDLHARIMDRTSHIDGVSVSIRGGLNRPPMERGPGVAALFNRAQVVARGLGLPELRETLSGGGSDGNFTAALGVPTLDGLGAVGGGAHALSEHVTEAEMPRRAALLAGLIAGLLEPLD